MIHLSGKSEPLLFGHMMVVDDDSGRGVLLPNQPRHCGPYLCEDVKNDTSCKLEKPLGAPRRLIVKQRAFGMLLRLRIHPKPLIVSRHRSLLQYSVALNNGPR